MMASPTSVEAHGPTLFLHHYVVVRKDLPLGTLAAQVVHAAGESAPGNLPEGTYAVVLAARDEAHLRAIADQLDAAAVPLVRIVESDAPHQGALMAVGLRPCQKGDVRRHLSSLPLLR
jgi:hypothetical protein